MGTLSDRGLVAHEATNQRETSFRNELETSLVYEAHVANCKISKFYRQRCVNRAFLIG